VPHVDVVLVRPENPENIGAAARAMKNAALRGLRLVDPGDWRTLECWRTAWGAQEILEAATVFDSLEAALDDAAYVAALTGRREARIPLLDVRDMSAEMSALDGSAVALLVFGPETTGLDRDELAVCGRRVFIPSDPAQPSLNLSHAVMVAAYEVFRARRPVDSLPRRADHGEKGRLTHLLREALLAIGALPESNTDGFFRDWQALFHRADLTPKEVRLLEHMARKMIRAGRAKE
jgi:tRNA/rRNA methyltransferase